uniref:Myb/SANT-like domain-containing protein n=1 Tax=Lactuca sativa TaxID=4236 RepID=A0A9R1X2N6_LACSA|nr:hypothetical protein LSAT_V11C800414940 [Lactuca sativa]
MRFKSRYSIFFLKIFKIQTISNTKTTNKTKTTNNNIFRCNNLTTHLGFQRKIIVIIHGISFLKGFQKPNSNLLNLRISSFMMLRMKNLAVLIKHNYTHRQKRKKWVERKELALARAYVDVFKDKQCGNQQRFNAFWERVLTHFTVQMGGLDRSRHQVNSKWKDL